MTFSTPRVHAGCRVAGKNPNKYDPCNVHDVLVQRIGQNVTLPLADGTGIVVYAKVRALRCTPGSPPRRSARRKATQARSILCDVCPTLAL